MRPELVSCDNHQLSEAYSCVCAEWPLLDSVFNKQQ
ncbi:mCG148281 [Mus musculus]|nr:mCG148281 [Mus musculus]